MTKKCKSPKLFNKLERVKNVANTNINVYINKQSKELNTKYNYIN